MTVCNFWIQGRCRYGDKCWNEHPRGGGGGTGGRSGGGGEYNSRPPQQSSRGGGGSGGGFGNRVWVNPAQKSGGNYVQPSSFSQIQVGDVWDRGGSEGGGGGNSWGRGGGGRDNQVKSSNFSFAASSPNHNRFSVLSPQRSFDKAGRGGAGDDNEKHLETIQKDMEIWETSGQWVLSCYSVLKATISGFTELCPEELRLEYYNTKASGDLQGYASAVNQLVSQWRSRVQELRAMNGQTRAAMLAELDNPAPQAASGSFGSLPVTGFGSSAPTGFEIDSRAPTPAQNTTSTSTFSFAAPTTGVFVSASSQPAPTGFSNAGVPASSLFGATASTSAPSAAGFSFAAPAVSKDLSTTGFGASSFGTSVSASGFSFASTATSGAGGFGGGGFGGAAPVAVSGFGKASGGFGFTAAETAVTAGAVGGLFTPQSELTADELKEFESKRFTLGQIPLRPPPAGMLVL